MHDEEALFGDPSPDQVPPTSSDVDGAATWQVEQLRRALDGRGLKDMASRKRIVEELAGRPVTSLRDLSWVEARAIQEALGKLGASTQTSARSSWDERDEPTWIDRL